MRCIEKLSKVLTANMPDETILIVSRADEGRRLITECAKAGHLLAGVRAATPLMLAQEICASFLARKDGPRQMAKGEAQDLLFQCLLAMPEEGFFAKPHVRERKTAEMLLATICELNRELADPLSGNDRMEAVQRLREDWARVKGENLLDEADLLWKAIRLAESKQLDSFRKDTSFVVLSTEIFLRLDLKLIQTVAEDRLTVFPVESPEGIRVPERCAGPCEQKVPIDTENIQFWRCRGTETEQMAIMRDILTKGKSSEDCAIVYLSADYVPGLNASAKMYHLPISIPDGIPMTDSTVYDVLKLLQGWKSSDYNAEELRRHVLSSALKIIKGKQFCYELRRKNIGWGKNRYRLLLEKKENGFPDDETAENWQRILGLLFQASDQSGTLEEQKQVLSQILDTAVGVRREEDASALKTAKTLLPQITWLEEGETVLGRLLEMAEQSSPVTGVNEKGSILAVPLSHAFCTGRKFLYFCGLSRFCMQSGALESPILLDDERMRIGLTGKQEKEAQTSFKFLLTLAQHEGEAILSYNDYDMERMNPLSPTPVYRRLLSDKETKVISCVPDEAWMIGDLISMGKRVQVKNTIQNPPDNSEEEQTKAELREAKSFHTVMKDMAFSASSLETALSCPFKFYMQKLIGLYPPAIPERRNDSWLEANEMGTLCHVVLERYYRNPEAGWEGILEEEIEKLKEARPEGPESAVKADTERAKRMIRRAMIWTENAGREVIATEKHFGKNADEEPVEIIIGDRALRLSGSIDRVDRMQDGTLAILDYKTGGAKSYRDKLTSKLQQYLYTRAEELLEPGQKIQEGGYLFLKDTADYLRVSQEESERKKKEKTILSLLGWMEDENRAMIAAPAFEIQADGSFSEPGGADVRKKEYEKCSTYCEYAGLCPAWMQIQKAAEHENEEVKAND